MKLVLSDAGSAGGVRIAAHDGTLANGVEVSGLALGAAGPDGALRLDAQRAAVRNLRMQAGSVAADVDEAVLSGLALWVKPPASAQSFEVLGLSVEQVQLRGVTVSSAGQVAVARTASTWRLDAIDELEGTLNAQITDAAWVFDAEVTVPIKQGCIDFNAVTVEHVGPDSSMGISHMGIYVDAPNGRTYLFLFSATHIPGATFERRGRLFQARVADRGNLQLQPFAECLAQGAAPLGQAPHQVEATLDRTQLAGKLRLGDGVVGTARDHLTLSGQAVGKNWVELSAAVFSHEVALTIAELSASEAGFELFGKSGRTGAISANVTLRATGLGRRGNGKPPALGLAIGEMTVRGVRLGKTS
jgi:hypothetical protein